MKQDLRRSSRRSSKSPHKISVSYKPDSKIHEILQTVRNYTTARSKNQHSTNNFEIEKILKGDVSWGKLMANQQNQIPLSPKSFLRSTQDRSVRFETDSPGRRSPNRSSMRKHRRTKSHAMKKQNRENLGQDGGFQM